MLFDYTLLQKKQSDAIALMSSDTIVRMAWPQAELGDYSYIFV